MSDKQEMLSKFAAQTGAEVPGVQEAPSNAQENGNAEPGVTNNPSTSQAQNEELFKDSFSHRTKLKPWQNPKYKGPLVFCIVLPFALLIAWIFKDGIPKPSLAVKTPTPPALPQGNEDNAKPATDGEWAAFASTNGMGQQFNSAAAKEQVDGAKKFQDQIKANQAKGAAGNPTTPPGEMSPSTKAAIEDSGPPMDDSGAPMDEAPPYRPPVRLYTPPQPVQYTPSRTPTYATRSSRAGTRVASVTPRRSVSQSKSVSKGASKSPRTPSPQDALTPQERIAAMIAATSTNGSGSESVASGVNHDDTGLTSAVRPASSSGGNQVATLSAGPPQSKTRDTSGVSPATSTTGGMATPRAMATQSGVSQPAYTAEPVAYLPSEAAVIQGQPQTLINRSQSAKGRLLTSIAFTSGDYDSLAGQPVEIELTEALGDLPVGTRVVAVVAANSGNYAGHDIKAEVVRLQPTALMVGEVEMPIPEGAILLSGKDNAPLIAKRGGSGFLRFLGGLGSMVSGGAGLTNFGASQNVEFGDSSYFQSVGTNVATGVLSNGAQQLQQSGAGANNVLVLKAGSAVTVSVLKPIALPWTSVAAPQAEVEVSDLSDPELMSMVMQTQGFEGDVNEAGN